MQIRNAHPVCLWLYLSTLTPGPLSGGSGRWRDDLKDSAGFNGLMKLPASSSRLWQLLSGEPLILSCLCHVALFVQSARQIAPTLTLCISMKTFSKAEGEQSAQILSLFFFFCLFFWLVAGYPGNNMMIPHCGFILNEFCYSNDASLVTGNLWIEIFKCHLNV